MIFATDPPAPNPLRAAIRSAYLADETTCIESLLQEVETGDDTTERIARRARRLVKAVRARNRTQGGLDAFLSEYSLSSQEGVVLMCLAEALLRIPDTDTADQLIRDKLSHADWARHLGRSQHLFVNASTWGLMLTGRVIKLDAEIVDDMGSYLGRLIARGSEPAIRHALKEAMRILGRQFVMGCTIETALQRVSGPGYRARRYSFDMLGEAALSQAAAEHYFQAYVHAIDQIGQTTTDDMGVFETPGISIKLSALHPRFEFAQRQRVIRELVPRVKDLAARARGLGIGLTLDTEEADRLEPTLDVFEAVLNSRALKGWEGFGLALQAYQKRALPGVDWLIDLAHRHGHRIPLRLVKGAYWDTEIKHAQECGLSGYPVFTRKAATDVSYLACAARILASPEACYPQFATHNARTVAAIIELARGREYEFQRLHGMGETLFDELREDPDLNVPCRIYAPVGSHADLLPYLVRRLLENGANTSFVNRIVDEDVPIDEIIADPAVRVRAYHLKPHPRIPLPADLYGPSRRNARGVNLEDMATVQPLDHAIKEVAERNWEATPLVAGDQLEGSARNIVNPADCREIVGQVREADVSTVEAALEAATGAAPAWGRTDAAQRAAVLEKAADLLEQRYPALIALCVKEGGRCIPDALAEAREAVDYCRYYAVAARRDFAATRELPGPTGEANTLGLHGRGVFACISPWNFPLAIFVGQIAAALAAGNAVIAKPARQTPLIAAYAVRLLHEAGIPPRVLHFLPGSGAVIGARLVSDPRIHGVAFTGSTETAWAINRALAERSGPIVPLIAETGGQNAMIVDSSALPEQVVTDALHSAFDSAGQRCSALRVLFLQNEIAPRIIDLLQGAMAELRLGDPALLATDVGPLIDARAKRILEKHATRMERQGRLIHRNPLPPETRHGYYSAPCAFEIDSLSVLEGEVFGPMLHVIRYPSDKLDNVIDAINGTGYGLTLGIHSRIEEKVRYMQERLRVGNIYINRNMIGAVVGVQPFGGEGLSGTGPKAGGPHYLQRFATERTVTVNSSAVGGNATLLSLDES